MVDIQLMSVKYLAKISSIDVIDTTTRTISIIGKDFINVHKVIFAGEEIKNYLVVSQSEIQFVMPPPPVDLNKPAKVIIDSTNDLLDGVRSSSIDIALNTQKGSSGFSRVLQKFLKILLTSKGSNIFNLKEGTSLVDLIGGNFKDLSIVDLSVDEAFTQIKDSQTDVLPPEEMITGVSVINSYFDPRRASINIELEVETADGLARFTEVLI